jgi:hypothetical protein
MIIKKNASHEDITHGIVYGGGGKKLHERIEDIQHGGVWAY